MKVIVFYLENKGYGIKLVTNMGTTIGETFYRDLNDAVNVAKQQHPDCEILIEE